MHTTVQSTHTWGVKRLPTEWEYILNHICDKSLG